MQVNRWRDFAERVGWTAIQALGAAVITALTTDDITWETGLRFVGTAIALAVCKVLAAQNFGNRGSGDAIPGGVEQ